MSSSGNFSAANADDNTASPEAAHGRHALSSTGMGVLWSGWGWAYRHLVDVAYRVGQW